MVLQGADLSVYVESQHASWTPSLCPPYARFAQGGESLGLSVEEAEACTKRLEAFLPASSVIPARAGIQFLAR